MEIGSRNWKRLVNAGRSALLTRDEMRWVVGDILVEIAPIGTKGCFVLIAAYAEEIEENPRVLMHWRTVASRWPAQERNLKNAFAVHEILESQPDREVLIKKRLTASEARRIIASRQPERQPVQFSEGVIKGTLPGMSRVDVGLPSVQLEWLTAQAELSHSSISSVIEHLVADAMHWAARSENERTAA